MLLYVMGEKLLHQSIPRREAALLLKGRLGFALALIGIPSGMHCASRVSDSNTIHLPLLIRGKVLISTSIEKQLRSAWPLHRNINKHSYPVYNGAEHFVECIESILAADV